MEVWQSRLVRKNPIFYFNWLSWQRPLRNQKRGPDRSYSNKYLSFGAKIAKIGPVDPEIVLLLLKKRKKEKLRKVKYIARSASLPGRLKNDYFCMWRNQQRRSTEENQLQLKLLTLAINVMLLVSQQTFGSFPCLNSRTPAPGNALSSSLIRSNTPNSAYKSTAQVNARLAYT